MLFVLLIDTSGPSMAQDGAFLPPNLETITASNLDRLQHIATLEVDYILGLEDLAFNPDGSALITGEGLTGALSMWDLQTGGLRYERGYAENESLRDILFRPDGSLIVSGGIGSACLTVLDEDSWERLVEPWCTGGWHAAFSPEGTWIAVMPDPILINPDRIIVFDVETQIIVAELDTRETGRASDLAFSGDGTLLAALMHDDKVHVWDTEDWSYETFVPVFIRLAANTLTFHPTEPWIVVGGCTPEEGDCQAQIQVWNLQREPFHMHGIEGQGVREARFGPTGDFLMAITDEAFQVLDPQTGDLLFSLPYTMTPNASASAEGIVAVEFNPDNTVMAIGYANNLVHFWGVLTNE